MTLECHCHMTLELTYCAVALHDTTLTLHDSQMAMQQTNMTEVHYSPLTVQLAHLCVALLPHGTKLTTVHDSRMAMQPNLMAGALKLPHDYAAEPHD